MQFKTLLLALLVLSACSTPQKSFEKRNYDRAFDLALAQLNRSKSVKENTAILRKSLNELIKEGLTEAGQLKRNDSLKDNDRALVTYEKLQDKISDAEPYLGNEFTSQLEQLQDYALEVQEELYQNYLQQGLDKLDEAVQTEQKQLAQDAYREFEAAKSYTFDNFEADSLMDIALEEGKMYYYVETDAPFELMEEWEIDRQFDDVEWLSGGFQQIYYETNRDQADCILEVTFGSIDFDIDEASSSQSFQKQVIDGYNTVTDTSGQTHQEPIYRDIEGTVVKKIRTKTGSWKAEISVFSGTPNCTLSGTTLWAETESEITEYELQGNTDAIPSEYKGGMTPSFEDEDDMIEEMIEDLYRRFVNHYF